MTGGISRSDGPTWAQSAEEEPDSKPEARARPEPDGRAPLAAIGRAALMESRVRGLNERPHRLDAHDGHGGEGGPLGCDGAA